MTDASARTVRWLSLLGIFVLGSLARPGISADFLYRYVDEEGVTVIDYTIPPQYVQQGYEILNSDGSLHKVVPRTLTADELADQSGEAYKARVAAEEAERLRKWDESLMLRYSSIEDIEAARDRALSELRIRISILRTNVRSLTQQVESNQERAADLERRGQSVPVELVDAINGLRSEIGETERAITERIREVDVVAAGYQRDIDRFETLLDKVELRRRASSSARD